MEFKFAKAWRCSVVFGGVFLSAEEGKYYDKNKGIQYHCIMYEMHSFIAPTLGDNWNI